MSLLKKAIAIIFINALILASGLIIIELFWRQYFATDINIVLNVLSDTNRLHNPSKLYSSENPVQYTRDRYGLRGDFVAPSQIDILAVGGSTTDQRYLDDRDEWVSVLHRKTGFVTANAGVDGQSTFGHIKNFEIWFPKIPGLRPSVIIFYVGVNDFYKDAPNGYDVVKQRKIKKGLKYYWTTSHLHYLYRFVMGYAEARRARLYHTKVNFDKIPTTKVSLVEKSEYTKLMHDRLILYYERLEFLADKAIEFGSIPLFVTQSTLDDVFFRNASAATTKIFKYSDVEVNGVDKVYMREILNQKTLEICRRRKDVVCVDLAANLKFNTSDFYDFNHNTPSGAKKIGEYLAAEINRMVRIGKLSID